MQVGALSFEGLEIMNAKNAVVCAVRLTRAARGAAAKKETEFNWVFAIVVCIIQCGLFEAIRAVTSKEKRYDWRNPVLALAATVVAIFICLML